MYVCIEEPLDKNLNEKDRAPLKKPCPYRCQQSKQSLSSLSKEISTISSSRRTGKDGFQRRHLYSPTFPNKGKDRKPKTKTLNKSNESLKKALSKDRNPLNKP